MQDCRVQIVHVDRIFRDAPTNLIGLTDRLAALNSASGEPHAERIRMMISSGNLLEIDSVFSEWSASELTAPDDECFFEQTATLKILQ